MENSQTNLEGLLEDMASLHKWNIRRLEIAEEILNIKESDDNELLSTIKESINIENRKNSIRNFYLLHTHGELAQIYRNVGLKSARDFLEDLVSKEEEKHRKNKEHHIKPHPYYNLAFVCYLSRFTGQDFLDEALNHAFNARDLFDQLPIKGKVTKKIKERYVSLANNLIALIYYSQEKVEDGRGFIDLAFDTHPTPPEARFTRGIYHLNEGNYNQAIHDLQIAARARRKGKEPIAEAYFHLARAYDKKRNSDRYMRHIKDGPERERKRKDLYRKAVTNLEKTIEFDPRFSLAYYKIGVLKLEQNCEEAKEYFIKALELHPKLAKSFEELKCITDCKGCSGGKFGLYQKEIIESAKGKV